MLSCTAVILNTSNSNFGALAGKIKMIDLGLTAPIQATTSVLGSLKCTLARLPLDSAQLLKIPLEPLVLYLYDTFPHFNLLVLPISVYPIRYCIIFDGKKLCSQLSKLHKVDQGLEQLQLD